MICWFETVWFETCIGVVPFGTTLPSKQASKQDIEIGMSNNKCTLSLDISLNRPGWAAFENEKLIAFEAHKADKAASPLEKLSSIEAYFHQVMVKTKPDLILIENALGNHGSTKQATLQILHAANWIVRLQAFKLGIPITGVYPISWKSYFKKEFHNKVKMSKDDNIKYVNQIFSLNLDKKNQDEADAISMFIYYKEMKL